MLDPPHVISITDVRRAQQQAGASITAVLEDIWTIPEGSSPLNLNVSEGGSGASERRGLGGAQL